MIEAVAIITGFSFFLFLLNIGMAEPVAIIMIVLLFLFQLVIGGRLEIECVFPANPGMAR